MRRRSRLMMWLTSSLLAIINCTPAIIALPFVMVGWITDMKDVLSAGCLRPSFEAAPFFAVPGAPLSAAVGDFNRDGWPESLAVCDDHNPRA